MKEERQTPHKRRAHKQITRREKPYRIRGFGLGYVRFSGIGGFQEQFVSEVMNSNIKIRGIQYSGGIISGAVSPTDYPRTSKIAHKHGVKLKSGERRGLYFLLGKYRSRWGLYLGALVFCAIISVWQYSVADISISGIANRSEVLRILSECGIEKGKICSESALDIAERQLILEIPDAAWVDVSHVGCRITVDVRPEAPVPEITYANQPCNIVAKRSALVVDSVVKRGSAVVNEGSGVPAGALLVSGIVADANGKVSYLHAQADVIGEFTEVREFFVPYHETVSRADGEQTQFKYLVYLNDIYPLFFGEAYVENAVYTEETEAVSLFGVKTPLKITTGTFTKYTAQDITRSGDDCLRVLKQQREQFERNFYSEYEIAACEELCTPEKDGVRLKLTYTLRGNIAQIQPIEIE
ncbi:MAG: sporulation protein YqfD [Oscillospiraceae bacterium]